MNRYRVKFEKTGKIIYIGHLDLLKLFQRSIKRARLDIEYSKGFNPHQLITFAIPLSLGVCGEGEYCDIRLNEPMDCSLITDRLNAILPLGLRVSAVRELGDGDDSCAAEVAAADYRVVLDNRYDKLDTVIKEILDAQAISVCRVVKKKEKTVDIRPMIYSLSSKQEGDRSVLCCTIATGSQGNLKVDTLLEYIYGKLGEEYIDYRLKKSRLELYKRNEDSELIPL